VSIISPSRIEQPILESRVLVDNRLGDPHIRPVTVYLPPGHDDTADKPEDMRFPSVYLLSSHGNNGPSLMNWRPWDVTIKEQLDDLIVRRVIGPMIIVMPDMWTRLGGSQYVNSIGMGPYEDYLVDEVVPMIDRDFRTIPDRDHRGILGRSSGGFGAITQAMHHPDVFGACACQSGDLYWEFTCLPPLSRMHQHLEKFGGIDAFITDIPAIHPKKKDFWDVIMTVCWSAAFGGNPAEPRGFDLPIDPRTGALDENVWARWLEHDPIRKLDNPTYVDALRQLNGVFVDVGQFDEYQLQVGARVLARKLGALDIPHIFEEYPDGHRSTHYRYADSLAYLYEVLR
jgi:S-formylglutathione hydrolase FrmB